MRTYRATLRIRLQEETAHDAEVQLNRFVRLLETYPGIIAEIGETDYDAKLGETTGEEIGRAEGKNNKANVRLIAAAPELLLEALKDMKDALDLALAILIEAKPDFYPSQSRMWPAMVAANRVIAKAEGRVS